MESQRRRIATQTLGCGPGGGRHARVGVALEVGEAIDALGVPGSDRGQQGGAAHGGHRMAVKRPSAEPPGQRLGDGADGRLGVHGLMLQRRPQRPLDPRPSRRTTWRAWSPASAPRGGERRHRARLVALLVQQPGEHVLRRAPEKPGGLAGQRLLDHRAGARRLAGRAPASAPAKRRSASGRTSGSRPRASARRALRGGTPVRCATRPARRRSSRGWPRTPRSPGRASPDRRRPAPLRLRRRRPGAPQAGDPDRRPGAEPPRQARRRAIRGRGRRARGPRRTPPAPRGSRT